jgi:hypothetical protein
MKKDLEIAYLIHNSFFFYMHDPCELLWYNLS